MIFKFLGSMVQCVVMGHVFGTSDHDPSNTFTFTPPKSCMFGSESYLFLQYDNWQVLVVNSSYIHIQNILVSIFSKVNNESIRSCWAILC